MIKSFSSPCSIFPPLVAARTYTWAEYRDVEYEGVRGSRDYKKWRAKVLKRDKYECQGCGSVFNLHAHHLNQYTDNIFLRTKVSNGVTLCRECHSKKHPWMHKAEQKTVLRKKER